MNEHSVTTFVSINVNIKKIRHFAFFREKYKYFCMRIYKGSLTCVWGQVSFLLEPPI